MGARSLLTTVRDEGGKAGEKGTVGRGLRASRREGRWLKWGGVQSDYAKLCPYVLAWKFHPSPGLPPGLGKCIYCCLSSVLYIAAVGASETEREPGGTGTEAEDGGAGVARG